MVLIWKMNVFIVKLGGKTSPGNQNLYTREKKNIVIKNRWRERLGLLQ